MYLTAILGSHVAFAWTESVFLPLPVSQEDPALSIKIRFLIPNDYSDLAGIFLLLIYKAPCVWWPDFVNIFYHVDEHWSV